MTFADLGLSDQLLRAVEESGYSEPTPIQRGAIPSVVMGRDRVGIAHRHAVTLEHVPERQPPAVGVADEKKIRAKERRLGEIGAAATELEATW